MSTIAEHLAKWLESFDAACVTRWPEHNDLELKLVMAEKLGTPVLDELRSSKGFELLSKRAKYVGLDISDHATVFVLGLSDFNIARMVMFVYALRQKQITLGKRVTMENLDQFFPNGYPDEKALGKLWVQQKGYTLGENFDNMLDNVDCSVDFAGMYDLRA